MPIYSYRCSSCNHEDEVLQKLSDALLTVCPECKRALREWLAKHPNDEWGKLMGPKKV